jgi:hypothetical protein
VSNTAAREKRESMCAFIGCPRTCYVGWLLTPLNSLHRGIAWAPACGKAMSELVLDGECLSVNLRPFDPARFTPNAGRGGRGRKKKGTSVGEQW